MKFYSINPKGSIAAGPRMGSHEACLSCRSLSTRHFCCEGIWLEFGVSWLPVLRARCWFSEVPASGPPRPLSTEYQPWVLFQFIFHMWRGSSMWSAVWTLRCGVITSWRKGHGCTTALCLVFQLTSIYPHGLWELDIDWGCLKLGFKRQKFRKWKECILEYTDRHEY